MAIKIKMYSYGHPDGRLDMFSRTFKQAVKMRTKESNRVLKDLMDNKYRFQNALEIEVRDKEAFDELEGAASACGIWAEEVRPNGVRRWQAACAGETRLAHL